MKPFRFSDVLVKTLSVKENSEADRKLPQQPLKWKYMTSKGMQVRVLLLSIENYCSVFFAFSIRTRDSIACRIDVSHKTNGLSTPSTIELLVFTDPLQHTEAE